jgi:hypothetical protein
MIPSYIEVLDSFPLLAADRVDRARLPAPVSPHLGSGSGPHVPADTELEADVARIWGEILGFGDVSVEDDFFCDLGGHSMTAARVISALRRYSGLQSLSMGDLYAHPTVRSLAGYAETTLVPTDADGAGADRPPPLRHTNVRVLSCGVAQMTILYIWLLLLGTPGLATSQFGLPPFVEIGDGVSIGFGTRVQPYAVQDGWLRIAPIRMGTNSFVGTNSMVLSGTDIGDAASVGDQSLLHADQRIHLCRREIRGIDAERLVFSIMHGNGNVIMVVDEAPSGLSRTDIDGNLARALCGSFRSVRVDGIAFVRTPAEPLLQMTYFERDGTHSQMCGNALRRVTRYGTEQGYLRPDSDVVATDDGP